MATDKPRFTIILEHDIASGVEDYWYSHRLKNKNAAINELLRRAFDLLEDENRAKKDWDISSAALDLARKYDQLNEYSQRVIATLVDLELKRPVDYDEDIRSFSVPTSKATAPQEEAK